MIYTDHRGHVWHEVPSPEGLRWERDDGDVLAVVDGCVVSTDVQGHMITIHLDVLLAFAERFDVLVPTPAPPPEDDFPTRHL